MLTPGLPENYVQNPSEDSLRPGALGLGESRVCLFVTLFLLLSYLTPTLAAVVSDNSLGKFRTIKFSLVYVSRYAQTWTTSQADVTTDYIRLGLSS
jgi:POT family proton-dependent oligopeptide transporter